MIDMNDKLKKDDPDNEKTKPNFVDGQPAGNEKINLFDQVNEARPDVDIEKYYKLYMDDWLKSGTNPDELSKIAAALASSLGWEGNSWDFGYSFPVDAGKLEDISQLRNVLARIGFYSKKTSLSKWVSEASGPCIIELDDGEMVVALGAVQNGLDLFDTNTGKIITRKIDGLKSNKSVWIFEPMENEREIPFIDGKNWHKIFLGRFKPIIGRLFLLTLIINLLALSVPLFIKSLYDSVMPTKALATLAFMSLGVLIAIGFEFFTRRVREGFLSHAGSRFDYLATSAVVNRLLHLPLSYNESSELSSRVPRLRDVERLRDFLFGSGANIILDLPFVLLFIALIWQFGGILGIVPIISGIIFAIVGLYFSGVVQKLSSKVSSYQAERQSLLLSGITHLRGIKATGSQNLWLDRFKDISKTTSEKAFTFSLATSLVQSISHAIGLLTGLATLVLGVFLVIEGSLTTGGLIAAMMMVWRIVSRYQGGFMILSRISQLKSAVSQISKLFDAHEEVDPQTNTVPLKNVKGGISLRQVTIRYSGDKIAAASGLNVNIEPRDSVAIVGHNGSGKSTILKMMAGLYSPQIGSVLIDGKDIRQFHPRDLRRYIAYAPQSPQFFEGTIYENMRYANPLVSREKVIEALDNVGILDVIEAMPLGIDTPVMTHGHSNLSYSWLIRLSLARVIIRDAPIVLLDEPINGLDFMGDFAFVSVLNMLKDRSTVVAITHRPGHIRAVDKVLLLSSGRVKYFGPSADVIDRITHEMM